ncbi:MAG TPA: hypothetical protein VMU53_15540 [Candidatus Sulfotelmatobacter sp.]|nr:hypothetical protein [Candidatus Sulfotelmatobacter sp.]
MSRNFELLREAGWRQELFEGLPTAPEPTHEEPVIPAETRRQPPVRNDQISMLVRKVFLDPHRVRNRAVMFSSVARGAGCTWTCAQAAKTLAGAVSGDVCVVDANFEAPVLHEQFSVAGRVGLADAVFASKRAKEFVVRAGQKNLWMLPAGDVEKRALSLSNGPILESHLRELRGDFDFLLIDGPPLTAGAHACSIGRAGDGAILVLNSAGIPPALLLNARKQLDAAGLPLFGVVLNQRESGLPPLLDRLMKR